MIAFANRANKNTWIVLGGSLFWAASLIDRILGYGVVAPGGQTVPIFDYVQAIAMLPAMLLAVFFSRFFREAKGQKVLALSAISSNLIGYACLAISFLVAQDFSLLVKLFLGCGSACTILFWGLNFAVLEKHEAERSVLFALLGGFAIFFVSALFPLGRIYTYFAVALNTLAMLPFLLGFYAIHVTVRAPIAENAGLLKPFFFSRFIFGVGIGLAHYLVVGIELAPFAPWGISIGSLVALLLLLWLRFHLKRNQHAEITFLRLSPFLLFGVLVMPFLGNGNAASTFEKLTPCMIWLCWAIMSSVQASDIKSRIGWDEARLTFCEKTSVHISMVITTIVAYFFFNSPLQEGRTDLSTLVILIAVVYGIAAMTGYLLSNIIDNKVQQRMVDKAIEISESNMECVYREIAATYKLTERESEVFQLAAKGHTRPFICEKLMISEGTARSHITHINQKLGVHSREELFELVKSCEVEFLNKASR